LKWDAVREKNLLLYPEGVLVLNQTANDILALCDGHRSVADITAALAARYQHEKIAGDVAEILQKLTDKGLVKTGG
jgi:pyrroloquinoline quinone biosynthesis protein D